jgi:hypothetical protein
MEVSGQFHVPADSQGKSPWHNGQGAVWDPEEVWTLRVKGRYLMKFYKKNIFKQVIGRTILFLEYPTATTNLIKINVALDDFTTDYFSL